MRWTRQEYLELMTFGHPPRPMLVELFGPLIGLEQEWTAQGASPGQLDLTDFCFDTLDYHVVGGTGPINGQTTAILDETEDYIIRRDYLGRTAKMYKNASTIAQPLDFPVRNMDDWRRLKHMYEDCPSRTLPQQIELAKKRQAQGAYMVASIPGGFDVLRELMGEENCCIAFYEDAELICDILNTVSATNVRVLDEFSRHVKIDQLSIHEDMAGKSGPLIGPATIKEFMKPYYRNSWELLQNQGAAVFCQDSDGNMNAVIDAYRDCGVNLFYPCEPAAGMDIVDIRKKYGNSIIMKGGIDKHVLRGTKPQIRAELEYKLQPMMRNGMVFGMDHRIPNGTPLENYIYYVETAREILGLPPIAKAEKGWCRMAF